MAPIAAIKRRRGIQIAVYGVSNGVVDSNSFRIADYVFGIRNPEWYVCK